MVDCAWTVRLDGSWTAGKLQEERVTHLAGYGRALRHPVGPRGMCRMRVENRVEEAALLQSRKGGALASGRERVGERGLPALAEAETSR
jgi:hypothetical protein